MVKTPNPSGSKFISIWTQYPLAAKFDRRQKWLAMTAGKYRRPPAIETRPSALPTVMEAGHAN